MNFIKTTAVLSFFAMGSVAFADAKPVTFDCFVLDQVSGDVLKDTRLSLAPASPQTQIYADQKGLSYNLFFTIAGDGVHGPDANVLLLSIERDGKVIARAGMDFALDRVTGLTVAADSQDPMMSCFVRK